MHSLGISIDVPYLNEMSNVLQGNVIVQRPGYVPKVRMILADGVKVDLCKAQVCPQKG